MPKRKDRRTIDQIMQADYIRLYEEGPQRWPFAGSTLLRKAKEKRIRTIGNNPTIVKVSHFEEQMEKGFPVLDQQESAA